MLTSFPTEHAQDKKVKIRILAHTFCVPFGAVHKGQEITVDHGEWLQLKAAGKAELVTATKKPKARPAGDDDVAFLQLKGYRVDSLQAADRFLAGLVEHGHLGSYLAELGAWVRGGRPGLKPADDQVDDDQVENQAPAMTEQVSVEQVPAQGELVDETAGQVPAIAADPAPAPAKSTRSKK